jgi:2-C-methyl-D-erythritol 4-phosphate cytidylyltransferase
LVESIRKVNGTDSKALDRNQYVSVQTPQCFKAEILHKAYNMPEKAHFTDDASVVEASGITVSLAQGEANNLKITTPKDLLLAESLLKNA